MQSRRYYSWMEQRVEILKLYIVVPDILILMNQQQHLTHEIEELIIIMKQLTKKENRFLLITHKIKEIQAVADRCTVIRRGTVIGTVEIGNVTDQELVDKDGGTFVPGTI